MAVFFIPLDGKFFEECKFNFRLSFDLNPKKVAKKSSRQPKRSTLKPAYFPAQLSGNRHIVGLKILNSFRVMFDFGYLPWVVPGAI